MNQERSIFSEELILIAKTWIETKGEIYVVNRFSHMAGGKYYYYFNDFEAYYKMLKALPPMVDVILFRDKQLSYRATADDNLKHLMISLWKEKEATEWTMAELIYNVPHNETYWYCSLEEIEEAFAEMSGKQVACGLSPDWWLEDHDAMQSGLTPMEDGRLVRGCY